MTARPSPLCLLGIGSALAAMAPARTAFACGVMTGGAAGITGCSLEEHEEATRDRWDVGASYSFTSTSLELDGRTRVDEERHASLATLDYAPTARTTVRAGAGMLVGGSITTGTARYDMAPGFVGALAGSWRVVDARGAVPFVLLTGQLSYAGTTAGGFDYSAFDLRGGAVVGTTVWDVLTPYVVGRAFGGPVFWRYGGERVTGTDVYHYQVGAGLALLLARRMEVFVEGVPLGERGLALGTSFAF